MDRLLTVGEEALPARLITSGALTATNGIMRVTCFQARKGEQISQVRMVTGNPAAVTPTLLRIGIYLITGEEGSYIGRLVASTANDTTLFAATNTVYTKTLIAPFWKTEGLRYGVGVLCVGAATAPNLAGLIAATPAVTPLATDPPDGFTLTGQTDLPAAPTFTVGGVYQPWAALLS